MVLIQNIQAQAPPGIMPVVAIHVSENTQAHWAYSTWTYFSINRMLEEAFKSDGIPYIEVTDQDIENGGLMVSGSPKYPILFSLTAECISDTAAAQISSYASAGGFVYAGSSSWTRYANGSYRADFALSSQMGVRCVNSPSNNWAQVQTATRTASNRLVSSVPGNVAIDWRLPLTDHTLPALERSQTSPHYAWSARTTTSNPATVLMTINNNIMLSIRNASRGLYIYHSELAPLASYDLYSPVAYEYTFFKEAVQWAFENNQVPLVRLSPWPYQYNSAFIVRHDMDISYERVPWIAQSAQAESNLGVVGQYYIVTGDVRDASNSVQLIGLMQQAQAYGAQIGSHNGGLNCTPWNPSLQYGAYEFYHWGPDYAMSVYPGGQAAGMAYASQSIQLSLDNLQGWLGQRPNIWVSPAAQSCWDESLQIIDNLGIACSGEATSAPYPQFAYSITTQGRTYDTLMVPFSRWITSSGLVCQSMEELQSTAPSDITRLVDFYYNQGVLVSPYSHSSSSSGIYNTYINYAISKPYMWSTTPSQLRDWALVRQQIKQSQSFSSTADGQNSITITLSGSSSADNALDIKLPFDVTAVNNLQVLINGNPSTNYRVVGSNVLKIQAGIASTVTVSYSTAPSQQQQIWTQTSQADFQAGTLTNLDATTVPGQLTLAFQTGGQSTALFYDDFSNASFTSSHWTTRAGAYTVGSGYYHMVGVANAICSSYSATSSWTDYSVETGVRYVSGEYTGELGARLNPSVGSKYSLLLYPNLDGPNRAVLAKFSSWQDLAGTILGQATVTTDTNWHTLRLELYGSSIKGYYDNQLLFNVADSSYSTGGVSLESYGSSVADYDWVNVTSASLTGAYYISGSIVSSAHDCGQTATWNTISWTGSTPSGTSLQVRTRTAATQAELSSASWSTAYSTSGATISSLSNRWIQYQVQLATTNTQTTPVLFDVTITYSTGSSPPPQSSSWTQTSQADFQAGTLNQLDAVTVPGQLTLAQQSSQTTVLFSDDFSNSSYTSSHWTTHSDSWTVSSGYHNLAGTANQLEETNCGDQTWTNYAVEARVRYVSGEYTGELGARLNPTTGARYSLLLYPNLDGPNKAVLSKFSAWQDLSGTTLGQTTVTTDTNWHTLRMELNGGNIKCYYDGAQIFNVNDNSYSSGKVSFESYGASNAAYDWVNVTTITGTSYYSSGTLVSSSFDSGSTSTWQAISWSASTPSGTNVQLRTRTASTQAGLASAAWSGYYTASGATITSPSNRWIQYEATLSTTNTQTTPTLSDVTITYSGT